MSSLKTKLLGAVATAALASAALYTPSDEALDVVKRHEGLRTVAYLDPVNIPTICYGSTVGVRLGQRATEAQCHQMLIKDIQTASKAVQRHVKVPITQGQFDALVSFTFNVGSGALYSSTMLKYINRGDLWGCFAAAAQFDRWVKADGKTLPGLVKRRAAERGVFELGCYSWPS